MTDHTRRKLLQYAGTTTAIGFAGCLNGFTGSNGSGDAIRARYIGQESQADWLEEQSDAFAEETGIEVEHEFLTWADVPDSQVTNIQSGTGPDVDHIASTFLPQQASADGWVDLSELDAPLPELDGFFDQVTDIMEYQGAVHGIPWFWGPRGYLEYDPLIEQAGIDGQPDDWDDLVEQGQAFRAEFPDRHLYAMMGVSWELPRAFITFLWQNGGQVADEETNEILFDSTEGVEALNFWKDLIVEDDVMPTQIAEWGVDEFDGALINEDVGAIMQDLSPVDQFVEQGMADRSDFTIGQLPAGPTGDRSTFFGMEGLGIRPWSDKQEEAAEWISWLAQPETNAAFADRIGLLPTVEAAFDHSEFDDELSQTLHDDVLPHARHYPMIPGLSEVEGELAGTIGQWLEEVVTGEWEDGRSAELLDEAAGVAQQLVDQAQEG
ncbi:extracellular solute-binding protein [Natrinema ejinorense]|uniref:ABC transporter substrate-binding protein n=1 Tax=Natrinema ejinorense TaxID=373386 RepID=A0A2A5QZ00_9EURY|nr:extracellular solute-binding protein [Natrinema ejinorense]PCR91993.1 ABC transporter substrate-binding protein [Natrinema ejinorense]